MVRFSLFILKSCLHLYMQLLELNLNYSFHMILLMLLEFILWIGGYFLRVSWDPNYMPVILLFYFAYSTPCASTKFMEGKLCNIKLTPNKLQEIDWNWWIEIAMNGIIVQNFIEFLFDGFPQNFLFTLQFQWVIPPVRVEEHLIGWPLLHHNSL